MSVVHCYRGVNMLQLWQMNHHVTMKACSFRDEVFILEV